MDEREIAEVGLDQLEHADIGCHPRQRAQPDDQEQPPRIAALALVLQRPLVGMLIGTTLGAAAPKRSLSAFHTLMKDDRVVPAPQLQGGGWRSRSSQSPQCSARALPLVAAPNAPVLIRGHQWIPIFGRTGALRRLPRQLEIREPDYEASEPRRAFHCIFTAPQTPRLGGAKRTSPGTRQPGSIGAGDSPTMTQPTNPAKPRFAKLLPARSGFFS